MFFFHQFPFTLKWTLLWKKQSISLGIRREKKRWTIYQKRRKRESHEIFQNPTDFFFPFPPTIHQELNGRREGVFFTPQMYQPLSLALRCAYVLVCVCVSSSLPGKFGKGLKVFLFFLATGEVFLHIYRSSSIWEVALLISSAPKMNNKSSKDTAPGRWTEQSNGLGPLL